MPNYPQYIVRPQHGLTSFASGTWMEVVLGPGAGEMYYGTRTGSGSIPKIMKPLLNRDPDKWVAGHLLNGELGGSGTDPENLTPLTESANKRHSSRYENKVKRMCIRCRQYMERYKITNAYFGVWYRVDVSTTPFGTFSPYDKVASHITVSARVYKYDQYGRGPYSLSSDENDWFSADYFNNGRVDNDDADLV